MCDTQSCFRIVAVLKNTHSNSARPVKRTAVAIQERRGRGLWHLNAVVVVEATSNICGLKAVDVTENVIK